MEIKSDVRQYIVENFLSAGPGASLGDTTPLITGGLIDSIGMISLVRFIETRFGIEFLPREVDAHRLDTLQGIEQMIQKKLGLAEPLPAPPAS